jgi:hypothetical protein
MRQHPRVGSYIAAVAFASATSSLVLLRLLHQEGIRHIVPLYALIEFTFSTLSLLLHIVKTSKSALA